MTEPGTTALPAQDIIETWERLYLDATRQLVVQEARHKHEVTALREQLRDAHAEIAARGGSATAEPSPTHSGEAGHPH